MTKSINILVNEGVISREVARKLLRKWVNTCDELYARAKSAIFSRDSKIIELAEQEIGLKPGKLPGFLEYIKPYVSREAIETENPKRKPLGYRANS